MKTNNFVRIAFAAASLGLIFSTSAAQARGGGGHGGGFGGGRGFEGEGFRGEGLRNDAFRGDGFRGDGARADGFGDRRMDPLESARDEGLAPRANESELRAGADREYGADRGQNLASDGGFGRAATPYGGAFNHDFSQTRPIAQANLVDHGAAVRSNFDRMNHPNFDRDWWARHNDWWGYDGWGLGWWGGVGWGDLAGYWGVPDQSAPVEYDYGNNISYNGDEVYYGAQPTASTVQYYQQAQTLAASAPPIPTTVVNGLTKVTGDWKPLGVFALTQSGDTNSNTIFQLAVNKAGVISGNYYNTLNDQSTPIRGKVDKKSMRVAFTVGKNKDVVYDTGLANLLEAQSTILVHLNKSKTQQETFVRLQAPNQANNPPKGQQS